VIIEGLYTFLDVEPWRRAAEVLDLRVFIDVDPRTARERLVRRCLAEGIEDTMEKAVERGECFCIAVRAWADMSFVVRYAKAVQRLFVRYARGGCSGQVGYDQRRIRSRTSLSTLYHDHVRRRSHIRLKAGMSYVGCQKYTVSTPAQAVRDAGHPGVEPARS
jgi:hypothetical protein